MTNDLSQSIILYNDLQESIFTFPSYTVGLRVNNFKKRPIEKEIASSEPEILAVLFQTLFFPVKKTKILSLLPPEFRLIAESSLRDIGVLR